MTDTLARRGASGHYHPPAQVAKPSRSEAGHQREIKTERLFFARLAALAAAGDGQVIARLRARFENAADPHSTPDTSDETLKELCRELHTPDQRDDTCQFHLVDGPVTLAEEEASRRALYLTSARIDRVTRCLEARRALR